MDERVHVHTCAHVSGCLCLLFLLFLASILLEKEEKGLQL